MYTIKQAGVILSTNKSLPKAIEIAEKTYRSINEGKNTNKKTSTRINCSNGSKNGTQMTLSVENGMGKVVASLSSHRIIGAFTKENWDDSRSRIVIVDTVEFDATDYVLTMEYADIIELQDSSEETDELGAVHVAWDGPRDVSITCEICQYFGVKEVSEISIENFNFIRNRVKPQVAMEVDVTLMVRLKLQVAPDANEGFLDALDWTFAQGNAGAVVKSAVVTRV